MDSYRAGSNGSQITHFLFVDDILLFAEASVDQMHRIMNILNTFCSASGQKISVKKTSVFFFGNIAQDLRDDIIAACGFSTAQGIGHYLGSLPHHGKLKKDNYKGIIEKMQNKLAWWKGHWCCGIFHYSACFYSYLYF